MSGTNSAQAQTSDPRPWRRWLRGWRAGLMALMCVASGVAFGFGWWRLGGAGILTLALVLLPCGIACALGVCILERRKAKSHCDPGGALHPKR